MQARNRGFTLIELLVVSVIISVLLAIGIVTYTSSTTKSRDTKRKSDLYQVRTALEAYRLQNGTYPLLPDADANGWVNVSLSTSSVYTALVGGGFAQKLPADPKNNNANPACNTANYGYFIRLTDAAGYGYQMIGHIEDQAASNCPDWCGAGPAAVSCYIVTNP